MKSVFLLACMILPLAIHSDEEIQLPLVPWERGFPGDEQPYTRISINDQPYVDVIVEDHTLYVASAFDQLTYVTAYSLAGDPVWEAHFNSEIYSWRIKDGLLFVFSRAHDDTAYYLTCIDANTGTLIWERAIVAPGSS